MRHQFRHFLIVGRREKNIEIKSQVDPMINNKLNKNYFYLTIKCFFHVNVNSDTYPEHKSTPIADTVL